MIVAEPEEEPIDIHCCREWYGVDTADHVCFPKRRVVSCWKERDTTMTTIVVVVAVALLWGILDDRPP